MAVFIFTYGTSDTMPYQGGWSLVYAPDKAAACAAFRAFHPDRTPGILNCSSVYTAEEFEKTTMNGPDGNFNEKCHEVITLACSRVNGGEPSA